MVTGRPRTDAAVHAGEDLPTFIERHLDCTYLVETLSRLAHVPTDVPPGWQTLMEPDDPKLVYYVQQVLRPELVRLGIYDLLDVPRNNLVTRLGTGESGRSLLIQNYTPTQHHNLMEDPFSGKVGSATAYGCDEPVVFGQGVSQNKAHQAVMLTVLKLLHTSGARLRGRLYWAINNEGRSTHACSEAILAALAEKPSFCVLQLGTDLTCSLGNRGRVDVAIHVHGKATEEIRAVIGDLAPYQVTITRDVFMLPALVDPNDAGIQALQEANRAMCGHQAKTCYEQGTFDAGGLVSRGVPTVMYGASGGVGLLGVDFVPISAVEKEARVLAHLILSQLA